MIVDYSGSYFPILLVLGLYRCRLLHRSVEVSIDIGDICGSYLKVHSFSRWVGMCSFLENSTLCGAQPLKDECILHRKEGKHESAGFPPVPPPMPPMPPPGAGPFGAQMCVASNRKKPTSRNIVIKVAIGASTFKMSSQRLKLSRTRIIEAQNRARCQIWRRDRC